MDFPMYQRHEFVYIFSVSHNISYQNRKKRNQRLTHGRIVSKLGKKLHGNEVWSIHEAHGRSTMEGGGWGARAPLKSCFI